MPRAEGPYKVLEKFGENVYKLEFPSDYEVSATFNVEYLSPYFEDVELLDLRLNPFEPGGNDEGASVLS